MTFKCRYKSMGLKECAETPGLYACSPCREFAAIDHSERTAATAGPLGKLRDMSDEERARLIGVIDRTLSQRSPLQEYLAKLELDILNSAAVPNFVLMGTPSSGAATAMEVEAQRYATKWLVPGALLDAEERRQRRDDHVDALKYALSGYHRHGKSEAMRLAEERSKHFNRVADAEVRWLNGQGTPLADIELVQQGPLLGDVCGDAWLVHKPSQTPLVGFNLQAPDFSPLRYRDRVEAIVVPTQPAYLHCEGCDMIHNADVAFVLGQPCPMCGWELGTADAPVAETPPQPPVVSRADCERISESGVLRVCGERREDGGAFCAGRVGHDGPHEWAKEVRYTMHGWHREPAVTPAPKPPTLREWLGPENVAKLGPWADVLREQPVPAGWITEWAWDHDSHGWSLRGKTTIGYWTPYYAPDVTWCLRRDLPWDQGACVQAESFQMAIFYCHQAVKPDPRLTIGCEDQSEV